MREISTDYLVIGAGASGMAFVDELIAHSDADVVMVDRRHRPGGHWLDAYPFVRIHQTSSNYGVASRVLGNDRIDTSGPNAGFYERATAGEICDYYNRVLEETFLASGKVRFLPMSDYRGVADGDHQIVSLVTGGGTRVKVRRKAVDATYFESTVPSRHTPAFEYDDGVRVIPPNDLVNLSDPPPRFTVLGAGKTSMDTCVWLLDQGVAPDGIRWVKPRDGWAMDRAMTQPLELMDASLQGQIAWMDAVAQAQTGEDFALRLEAAGLWMRVDENVLPEVFRGVILSRAELDALRRIDQVVRLGKVLRIGTKRVTLSAGEIPSERGEIYVDCTAPGLSPRPIRPVFEADRITMQPVTAGIAPWSAATIGAVESMRDDDVEKNRLCPPIPFTGEVSKLLHSAYVGMKGAAARFGEPDIAAWNNSCRLNPGRGAAARMDDPKIASLFGELFPKIGLARSNLERLVGAGEPATV